jgi:outer membrane protein OmpA-like peptidoglycan-associated protein
MINYQFPINSLELVGEDYNFGIEMSLIRHLISNLNLAIPLKLGIVDLPKDKLGNVYSDQFTVSIDALAHFKILNPEKLIYPYALGGFGITSETKNNWKVNAEIPLGLGLNFRIIPHLYFSLESQYRLSFAKRRSQLQHTAGVWLNLGDYNGEQKVRDNDEDGIPNKKDRCPQQPGTALAFGCPDTDGDGIPDFEDDCPLLPGSIARRGCPEARDTDGDGIIDEKDKCPNEPGPALNEGCPEIKQEDKNLLELAQRAVQFETASSKLLPASFKILDEIATLLRKYPDHNLRIEGHTDSIGSFEDNQSLSERRAKSCHDYFVAKGISSSRLRFRGFGEFQPIADNRYESGRERNRRVEFHLYVD